MAGFDDRHVELRIKLGFVFGCSFGICGFHFGKYSLNNLQVRIRPQARRTFSGHPLHVTAKGQVIKHGLVMAREKLRQGRGKGRAKNISDKHTRPGPRN